jgi:hypothetical protein
MFQTASVIASAEEREQLAAIVGDRRGEMHRAPEAERPPYPFPPAVLRGRPPRRPFARAAAAFASVRT